MVESVDPDSVCASGALCSKKGTSPPLDSWQKRQGVHALARPGVPAEPQHGDQRRRDLHGRWVQSCSYVLFTHPDAPQSCHDAHSRAVVVLQILMFLH